MFISIISFSGSVSEVSVASVVEAVSCFAKKALPH
jgi:hypothetical protein